MRRISTAVSLLAAGLALWAVSAGPPSGGVVSADDDGNKVVMRDDCDPNGWPGPPPGGGCALEQGDVSNAEFVGELAPPLSLSVIGHQAWRNDPSYLKIEVGDTVKVRNKGGRGHTFTKVANFGGGRVPPPGPAPGINQGLSIAPECANPATSPIVPPGGKTEVSGLPVGNHRFQCCLHPWMRAVIKVQPEEEEENDDDDDDDQ